MISVTASGFVPNKPQLQYFPSNRQKVEFDVVSQRRAYVDGAWKTVYERATFVSWGEEAEDIATHLDKGSNVSCTGLQETSEWTDKDGNKRSKVRYQLTAWIKEHHYTPRPQGEGATDGAPRANDGRQNGAGNPEPAGHRQQPPRQQTSSRPQQQSRPAQLGDIPPEHDIPVADYLVAPVNQAADYILM